MELQYWIWIAVGLSFSLYMELRFGRVLAQQKSFMLQEVGFIPLPMEWQLQPTGCLQPRLYRWQESFPLVVMMGLYTNGLDRGLCTLGLTACALSKKIWQVYCADFIGDRYYSTPLDQLLCLCFDYFLYLYRRTDAWGRGCI